MIDQTPYTPRDAAAREVLNTVKEAKEILLANKARDFDAKDIVEITKLLISLRGAAK